MISQSGAFSFFSRASLFISQVLLPNRADAFRALAALASLAEKHSAIMSLARFGGRGWI